LPKIPLESVGAIRRVTCGLFLFVIQQSYTKQVARQQTDLFLSRYSVTNRPIGSLWGKWDLHFHTPSSFDYANGSVTNSQIVEGLKNSGVVAVAITDHHRIDVPRIRDLHNLAGKDLTVFTGIELRSELGGKESVHLIGIFPESKDPDFIWTKLQGPLKLTAAEVSQVGDDKVYVKFEQAAELIHDLGGIVSVHVGRKSNSLENIGNQHPYKQAFKADLVKAHIDLFEIGKLEDAKDYESIVFPSIGVVRPIVICSDNHDIADYKIKAPCWIKADPVFEAFQQIMSDPSERVYLGEIPASVDRVNKNPTKYISSIEFKKVPASNLSEDWFSGKVPLNPGLIAIIGNKGMGKTALAESIGLLGNTAQHRAFSFLHNSKFKQPKQNKAIHFEAFLLWVDGHAVVRKLSDEVSAEATEMVSYIPQHYIETICNELQSANSRFEGELKAVIFSHVSEAERLGTDSLDSLIGYLTEQTFARLSQIRNELKEINKQVAEFQRMGSVETKKTLEGLFNEKTRELEAHDKAKPAEIKEPEKDPLKQAQMQAVTAAIQEKRELIKKLSGEVGSADSHNRAEQLRKAVAERILGRLRNFSLLYNNFLTEAEADCTELGLSARDLVKVEIDSARITVIRDEAQIAAAAAESEKLRLSAEVGVGNKKLDELTSQLDAPNAQYQTYLKSLQVWTDRRNQIFGNNEQAGSINYLQAQISDLSNIPTLLKAKVGERELKVKEIYAELQQLVKTYRTLYDPVQVFIENHNLVSGKFQFEFEALITNVDLGERLFQHINQGRKGTFNGMEEGKKRLNYMIETADFETEQGVVKFVTALLESLTSDKRESPSPPMMISEQLKKGSSELDVLNAIFSLEWLAPKYSLRWSGKDLEQLSPGERGTLLLIFYLLIDRRDVPLIIDQPEENLDNQTVYELLVPCIKEARRRRQVVIVTHNPNLAVVCDADQVMHCSIDKVAKNRVTYLSGSLENPALNRYTVDVLEGTKPAFHQRDSKYQA
jgi:hypothetical protein